MNLGIFQFFLLHESLGGTSQCAPRASKGIPCAWCGTRWQPVQIFQRLCDVVVWPKASDQLCCTVLDMLKNWYCWHWQIRQCCSIV